METHEALLLLVLFDRATGIILDVTTGEWTTVALSPVTVEPSMTPNLLLRPIFSAKLMSASVGSQNCAAHVCSS